MQKLKTKKSVSKRFIERGDGTIKCIKACRRHLQRKRSTDRKRSVRGTSTIHASEVSKIRAFAPYGVRR